MSEPFEITTTPVSSPRSEDVVAMTAGTPLPYRAQRVGAFLALPRLLRQFGLDPPELLREAGLPADLLETGDNIEIPSRIHSLLNLAAERSGCPHFGLLVGQTVVLESLGDLGRLTASAADVRTALLALARYFRFHNSSAIVWMTESPRLTVLSYGLVEEFREPAIQFYAGIGSSMCSIVHGLCGRGWSPLRVCLPFKRPTDLWPYRNVLRAPLEFNAETASIVFETAWLRRPVATANPDLYRQLEQHFRQQAELGQPNFEGIVRGVIRMLLTISATDLPAVAEALAVHPRTLERRLALERLSFRELVEHVKRDAASQLLRDSILPIERIAAALQYSSAANFATAFRQWTGMTPTEFRARATTRAALSE